MSVSTLENVDDIVLACTAICNFQEPITMIKIQFIDYAYFLYGTV